MRQPSRSRENSKRRLRDILVLMTQRRRNKKQLQRRMKMMTKDLMTGRE